MRRSRSFVFNSGARGYAFLTAQEAWRESCRALARDLGPSPKRIVDLGCGPGVSTFEIARLRPEDEVIGLDFAVKMLEQARRRERDSGLARGRVAWIQADAERLPFRDGSVDVLTGHSFLYIVPARSAALHECARVLRPGGVLRLMEPNGASSVRGAFSVSRNLRFLASMVLWRPFSRTYGHFTRESLAETLREGGFRDVAVEETLGGQGLIARAARPGA